MEEKTKGNLGIPESIKSSFTRSLIIERTLSESPSSLHVPQSHSTLRKSSSTSSLGRLRERESEFEGPSTHSLKSPTSSIGGEEEERFHLPSAPSFPDESGSREYRNNYYKYPCGQKKNEILVGVVVSRWDNIVGPQCVYLWTEERTSCFFPANLPPQLGRLVKYVTDHTVDHHDVDGNLVTPNTFRSTLCLVDDLQLAYVSVSIRVPSPVEEGVRNPRGSHNSQLNENDRPATTVPHSVAILAHLSFLTNFLLLRPLLLNWLAEFTPKIGVLLYRNKLQSSMINSWCAELCKTMTGLRNCWWNIKIPNDEEIVPNSPEVEEGNECLETLAYLPPQFGSKIFWEQLITSHLTTSCSTIVVGSDVKDVNQVIRFLLCFNLEQERYCSRYILPTIPDTYMKGLFVQGLMLRVNGEKRVSFNQVTTGRSASTYVELSPKVKVRQTKVQSHKKNRKIVLLHELNALWNSTTIISPHIEPFPAFAKESGGFVSKMVNDIFLLPPERRYARIVLFRRLVLSKAMSLITYIYSLRGETKEERSKLIRWCPISLGFDPAEYALVQVAAEKLRPGITEKMKAMC